MNALMYESIEQEQLERLLERKRRYLAGLPRESRQAMWLVSEVRTLEGVLLALRACQNMAMGELVSDITRRLSAAVRMEGAEHLNGLLYYYRLREPDEDRGNLIALAGGGPRDELRIKDVALWDGWAECPAEIVKL